MICTIYRVVYVLSFIIFILLTRWELQLCMVGKQYMNKLVNIDFNKGQPRDEPLSDFDISDNRSQFQILLL